MKIEKKHTIADNTSEQNDGGEKEKRLTDFWNDCFPSEDDSKKLSVFFKQKIESTEYGLTVYMDRRCAALARYCCQAFGYSEKQIVSHNALPGMLPKLKELQTSKKKILVVDDILIHGRAIQKIWDYLRDVCGFEKEKIDVDVFGYCVDPAKCLKEETKRRILPSRSLGEEEWRRLSGQMIRLVSESGFPHAAFAPSYSMHVKDFSERIKGMLSGDHLIMENLSDNRMNRVVWVPTEPVVEHELVSHAAIRAVYNRKTEQLSLIPFVMTKPIRTNQASALFRSLADALPKGCDDIKKALKIPQPIGSEKKPERNALIDYQMRLLNAVLSVWYGARCLEKYVSKDIKDSLIADMPILRSSFSKEIGEEFTHLEKAARAQEFKLSFDASGAIYRGSVWDKMDEDERKTDSIWKDCKELHEKEPNEKNKQRSLYAFFAHSGEEDDRRAFNNKNRLKGLPSTFLDDEPQEELAYLADCWDRGSSSLAYHVTEDEICEAFSAAGEQSYQYYLREYGEDIKKLQEISDAVWYEKSWKGNMSGLREKQKSDMEANVMNSIKEERKKTDLLTFLGLYGKRIYCWSVGVS